MKAVEGAIVIGISWKTFFLVLDEKRIQRAYLRL